MRRAFLADTHVTDRHDPAYEKLLAFLQHQIEIGTDEIFLLGDIFEYMCGRHEEYLVEFREFFVFLGLIAKNKKKLYYFEGNHDIHLSGLFARFQEKMIIPIGQIHVCRGPMIFEWEGQRGYVSHGDELAYEEHLYQFYKKFIRSRFMEFFVNHFLSYRFFLFLARIASKFSRRKRERISREKGIGREREKLLRGIAKKIAKDVDILVCGHFHVRENSFEAGLRRLSPGDDGYLLIDEGRCEFLEVPASGVRREKTFPSGS
jgi:UDP-2,3-diacylglucosamine hydrolase